MKKKEIMKQTGCTKKQAKYLKKELKKYPNIKRIFEDHIGEFNLTQADELNIIKCVGFKDDECMNLVVLKITDTILGVPIRCLHKYCLSTIGGDHVSYENF